jgi:chromosome segregation ATPase
LFIELEVADQKQQIVELEDELQTTEDARLRLDVNIGAIKQQIEKLKSEFNTEIDQRTRAFAKRSKEYEAELDEERKSKQQILQQYKEFENDIQIKSQQLDLEVQ